ncbi:hypothetical protein SLEP1_g42914 [Rubroshorea leprosula]|uniref:Uncharacterized protein n=1 Tax=Rubroshorea leprosula TaxID=152421 RepID=A0AAV5LBD4_9ROSI|nr:hypothetical protein SLEP1_g42914 [Rubroshorea leprosula]
MSSEEARSVVGSEVMPLDYGSMDTESSPSPTSSERTVEERRDEGVVEEEEEEIPSNVLESGGGVDGCYDPDLEIVSEVMGYVSELGSRSQCSQYRTVPAGTAGASRWASDLAALARAATDPPEEKEGRRRRKKAAGSASNRARNSKQTKQSNI